MSKPPTPPTTKTIDLNQINLHIDQAQHQADARYSCPQCNRKNALLNITAPWVPGSRRIVRVCRYADCTFVR